jgi:hypothetical protein
MPWLNSQTRPHTRSCYERDAERLLAHAGKSLKAIGLGDLQKFECLADRGRLGSRLSRPHACCDKSLYSFCCRTRHLATNPASEMSLPLYEKRLAERIMTEEDIARVLGGGNAGTRSGFAQTPIFLRLTGLGSVRIALAERPPTRKFGADFGTWQGRKEAFNRDKPRNLYRIVPTSFRVLVRKDSHALDRGAPIHLVHTTLGHT